MTSAAGKPKRVVVTGYGAICSLGNTSLEIWESIRAYRVGYRMHEDIGSDITARFFAFLDETERVGRGMFPRSILKALPAFARNAMVAAQEALDMAYGAGTGPEALDRHHDPFQRAVVLGTGFGGVDNNARNAYQYRDAGLGTSFTNLMQMKSIATAAASMRWGMRGYQASPVAACATGSIAVGEAYRLIRNGYATTALAGGSDSIRDQFNVWAIDVMQALSKEREDVRRACCPFSRRRSGFVLAEGAAVLCLEEQEHAERRGARILGEITGFGSCGDAFDFTAPATDHLGRVRSIEAALWEAGRQPEDIGYVNLHGTSTPLNDINETACMKKAFGRQAARIPMSSTKSYSGHLLGGAGALETILCLKVIKDEIAPATIHLDDPDPDCDLDYVPNLHRPLDRPHVTLNVNFGFGGTNSALVVERYA